MEVVQSAGALNMVLVNDMMWYWISVFPEQCIHTFVIFFVALLQVLTVTKKLCGQG